MVMTFYLHDNKGPDCLRQQPTISQWCFLIFFELDKWRTVNINLLYYCEDWYCTNRFLPVTSVLYLFFVKMFDTLSLMAATWCRVFCRITVGFVALEVSSGSVAVLSTIIGLGGRFDHVRLAGISLAEPRTWQLYVYVSGWTNMSQLLWLSKMYSRSQDTSVFLYLPTCPLVCGWNEVVVKIFTPK